MILYGDPFGSLKNRRFFQNRATPFGSVTARFKGRAFSPIRPYSAAFLPGNMSYAAYMVCCPYKTLGVTGKTMKNFKFGPGSQPCMRRTVRQPDFPSVPCPDIVPRVIPSEHPLKSTLMRRVCG
ncbi:MAG: hypothetical protein GX897_09640 [Clostridiales bacterium]|nr:hypothetical protein [Clostridiales bacterium]